MRSRLSSTEDPRQSVVDRAARFIAQRPVLVIGGASAITTALLLGAALVAVSSSGTLPDGEATALASAPAQAESRAAPRPMASSSPETKNVNAAPASALGAPEPLPIQLQLAADQPIARVRIGKRTVNVEVPAPSVAIDLTPAESKRRVSVVAWTSDGRTATGSWSTADTTVDVW